ncbi:cell wall-binding repeat-containing protein [Herbiconiux liangxiaofengii]|uniref:cell wall-binding repeat-containing protein n=1 Tax=Herbiconiux liangxiaofengii TaxID=3342795 RepID=UPI0035B96333
MKPSIRRATAVAAALTLGLVVAPLAATSASATNFVVATIPIPATTAAANPVAVAVDADARRAYVANIGNGTVSVIDTATESVIETIPAGVASGGFGPTAVAIDTARHLLFISNSLANTVTIVDVAPGGRNAVLKAIPVGNQPGRIDVDSELGKAYVLNYLDGTVSVIDIATRAVSSVIPHDSAAGIGTSPMGISIDTALHKGYVTNWADGSVSVFSTRTDSVTKVLPQASDGIGEYPAELVADAASHRAFVVNNGSKTVSVVNTLTDAVEKVITGIGDQPFAVGLDTVGGQIWVSVTNNITAIDVRSLAVVRTLAHPRGASIDVDAAHRRAYVATSSTNSVDVMDLDATAPLSRRSGVDRFEGSAAMSASEFAPGVDVAYVASGANYPDALSGSAIAGRKGGPVLLVTRDAVPASVTAELVRLKPKKIIVLGGTASVGAGVEGSLGGIAPVTRLGGADRFAVSAAVSADGYPAGTKPGVVFVASGENFPDALSGAAAAAKQNGPVLLVTRDAVPDVIAAELTRLAPPMIVVLGGENSVSAKVEAQLDDLAPTTRIAGADRFAAAAAISANVFSGGASTVYIASGTVFSDALPGGPLAAAAGGPVLLVRPDAIPDSTSTELQRLKPTRIVVLGGPATITPAVYDQLRDFLPR